MSCLSVHIVRQGTQETVIQTNVLSNDVKKIATGVFASLAAYPVIDFITNKVCELMTYFQFDLSNTQDAVQILVYIEEISSAILRTAALGAFVFYVVILGPILEEVIFRGGFNVWVKNQLDENGYDVVNNSLHKALYWTICGIGFGALHLSPYQGWTNVPVFLATSLAGVLLSALKDEEANDLTSSCTAHMTHNGVALARYFLAVKV